MFSTLRIFLSLVFEPDFEVLKKLTQQNVIRFESFVMWLFISTVLAVVLCVKHPLFHGISHNTLGAITALIFMAMFITPFAVFNVSRPSNSEIQSFLQLAQTFPEVEDLRTSIAANNRAILRADVFHAKQFAKTHHQKELLKQIYAQ
jgi:hypothetical protein